MGKQWKQWQNFIFLCSRITADRYCSHKIKRHLLFGRKVMTNLGSIFKSRETTLPIKVCRIKAIVFPVVIYGCNSWTIKKSENKRIDVFKLWYWRRFLSPLDCKETKWVNPKYSSEGLKLKLQYFGHVLQRADSLKNTLMLGKIEGKRRRGQQMRWLDGIPDTMYMSLSKLQTMVKAGKTDVLQFMGSQRVRHDLATEQ